MSWWSLFRSTVVPAVQQAISQSTQPADAPPAAVETDDPAEAERRRLLGGGIAGDAFAAGMQRPDAQFAPSSFAQGNEALMALEEALYNGTPLPPEIRAQLAQMATPEYVTKGINIMGIRDRWYDENPWGRGDLSLATDQDLYDEFRALNEWRADHAGNAFSREFGDELQLLASFDPSGLSQLALGDTNPHGMLGLMVDPVADLTGTRPEEWAGGMRSVAGTLNPFVGAGLSMAPVLAYGADVEDQARQFAISQGLRYVGGQAAPYIKAGVSATFDWIRQLGLSPEQTAALEQVVAEAAASGYEMTPEDLAEFMSQEGAGAAAPAAAMPGATPDPSFSLESLARSGAQPMFSTPAQIAGEGGMLSRPAMTTFSTPGGLGTEVSLPTADVPLDWQSFASSITAPQMPAAQPESDPTFEGQLEQTGEGEFEQPAQEQPAAEPSATENFVSKQIQNQLQKALSEMLGLGEDQQPADAPTRDEGETDEQFTEELLTYLGLDAKAMAEQGLEPGSPEYMQHILEQADLRIAELTEGLDMNAEDLSAQLRNKTDEELKALQRALFVRGQLEAMTGSGTVVDPTTGEDVEVIGEGMFNPGVAGYQAGLGRDIENVRSVDQLMKLLTRGFDPYGMEASRQARFEEAKRNDQDEEELRRRRGMLSY